MTECFSLLFIVIIYVTTMQLNCSRVNSRICRICSELLVDCIVSRIGEFVYMCQIRESGMETEYQISVKMQNTSHHVGLN
jgi:hypothetical protein